MSNLTGLRWRKPVPAADRTPAVRSVLLYVAMFTGAVLGYVCINAVGSDLVAPAALTPGTFGHPVLLSSAHTLLHVLLAMAIIMMVARSVGAVFRKIGQPPVIGEMVAGILLGPSLLGWASPSLSAYVLPSAIMPLLSVIAQIGVILFMFIVGIELDTPHLRRQTRATIAISHASIVVPFLLGLCLALPLYAQLSTRDVPFYVFALFMGVSMSVTAFPVLARILTDRGMHRSHLGTIALACAAVDDVTAWCLLALVVGVAQAQPERVFVTLALTAGFAAIMFGLVRPLVLRWAQQYERDQFSTQAMVSTACIALLLSALATEGIGIHALVGAFLLGSFVPHDSKAARDLRSRLEDAVLVLFLPAFFAFAGMRTQIALLSGANDWLLCGAIIVVASAGKFGGSAIAARLCGFTWRQSATLGVLMNTRGLMELIVLNIGLDLGVLSPTLFAMLVLMAIVTTMATTPIVEWLNRTQDYGAS